MFVNRPSFERYQGSFSVERMAEPRMDMMMEDEGLLVLVELPGVEERHIDVHVHGDVLAVETKPGPAGRFYHELLLPFLVEDAVRQRFNNGVLEIELSRLEVSSLDGSESHDD
jgi:HSP20 family molecular chaperone IbpA